MELVKLRKCYCSGAQQGGVINVTAEEQISNLNGAPGDGPDLIKYSNVYY